VSQASLTDRASSSWTNLIERWFKELTDRRLRRGVFTSVSDLQDAIKLWATHWNDDPKPFVWKATADDIITKVRRGRATLTRLTNTQMSIPQKRGGMDYEE